MRTRRTPALLGALAVLCGLAGCGSQGGAPGTAPTGTPSGSLNGTSPSPSTSLAAAPTPSSPPTPAPTTVSSTADPVTDTRRFAVVDPETGDFVAGLSSGVVVIGELGIHGVGAAWTTRRVTVTRTPDGLVAHYDGPGRLQRHAPLQLGLAALSASGDDDSDPVRFRFDVALDADGFGRADVWIEGRHYRILVTEPPHTADPVVTAVVAAFRAEDWSALYDLTVRLPGMSRSAFVRTFGADGSITELEITGDTVYRVVDGLGRATTPAHVVATIGQRHLDRDVAVQLIYRNGAWRFSSLSKGMDGT